jgi:hypothetical protein
LNKKEYEESILSTDISTIINYIKESIPILINKKLDELNKQNFKENILLNERYNYDNQLKNLESQLRFYISKQLQFKIQRDTYEIKLRNLMDLESEYENLKQKLKYDGKNFLDNDRKENEIEILRRENSNLKKAINQIELEKKLTDSKREISQKTILSLKIQLEKLNNKLYKVEKELKELKQNQNSNINININNNLNQSSKLVIKQHNDRRNSKLNKRNQNDSEKSENFLSDIINTKSPLNSNYKHSINATKQKHRTNSTGSINEETKRFDLISKYCNNNNIMRKSIKSNSNKISKKTLFSIHKKQKYEDFLTYMSKMYLGGNRGSRSANRSTMRKKD